MTTSSLTLNLAQDFAQSSNEWMNRMYVNLRPNAQENDLFIKNHMKKLVFLDIKSLGNYNQWYSK